jgi:hypothetical protein
LYRSWFEVGHVAAPLEFAVREATERVAMKRSEESQLSDWTAMEGRPRRDVQVLAEQLDRPGGASLGEVWNRCGAIPSEVDYHS